MSETNAAAPTEAPTPTQALEQAKPSEPKTPPIVVQIGRAPVDTTELMKQAQIIAHGRGKVDLVALSQTQNPALVEAKKQQAFYDTAILIMAGAEVGMSPVQATQALYVTEGRVGWMMTGALSRLRSCGALGLKAEDWDPTFENLPPDGTELAKWPDNAASVISFRRTSWSAPRVERFTVADAKMAELWGKTSAAGKGMPWTRSPKRMLQARCAGFIFKDFFSDALLGIPLREENEDLAHQLAEGRHRSAPVRSAPAADAKPTKVTFSHPLVVDAELVDPRPTPETIPSGALVAEPEPEAPTCKCPPELCQCHHAKANQPAAEPVQFDEASAQSALRAECQKRTNGDNAAAVDLFREIFEGVGGLETEEQYDDAMAAVRQHPVFGDEMPADPPVLTPTPAAPKKGGRK